MRVRYVCLTFYICSVKGRERPIRVSPMTKAELLSIDQYKKLHDQLGELAVVAWRVFGGVPMRWDSVLDEVKNGLTPRAALEAVIMPLITTTIAEVKAVRDLGPLAKSVLEELAKPGVVKVQNPEGLTLPHNKVLRVRAEKLLPRNTCVDLVIKAKWKEPSFDDVVEFIKQEQQQQQ